MSSSLLFLTLAYLVLIERLTCHAQSHGDRIGECRLEHLSVMEPTKRVESEGGVAEFWDDKSQQLQCIGVTLIRYTIRPKGLLLPFYTNAPRIHYILQGKGVMEIVVTGCRAMYRSSTKRGMMSSYSDEHQKIQSIEQNDAVAVPSSSVHWIYNTGHSDLVLFSLVDVANADNQLDPTFRNFLLSGNGNGKEGEESNNNWFIKKKQREAQEGNVFSGLALETLIGSFNVQREIAEKVQGLKDWRGSIILVKEGLDWLSPEEEEEEEGLEKRKKGDVNGIEETLCSYSFVHPLGEPRMHADKYNPRGGHITSLNTPNMAVLQYLQLGLDRGVLYKDAILVPHYNLNCHAVIYCTRGSALVQVINENGKRVLDEEVKEGQVLIVPQHYIVVKKAGSDAFDWVAIKTSDNPIINTLAGELSLVRAIPEAVLMSSYRMERKEARLLKRKGELTIISPPLEETH
ncbi:hypothetical protein HN51_022216 [Arachis hypogaea]|uniref:Cupin type-1 domain-containing protein n=2 Tax=Arachis TaxID=3817 RepID=A0A445EEP4_ARAHY|nr:legumin B [Arachis duranensis]XP_025650075.1 legumin B [Arachis hypogaea]QHO53382.1 11S globulin subunit beta [Arachis hypogaea]RYR73990.1 hypothetical protein Ahy_A02g008586 [Arachis hypogaea]